jgi:dinuclear metal center YbgI/SA1388 family protein
MTKEVTARDIIRCLDQLAPPSLAMPGDRIGLQVGRMDKPVKRVWLALDPSPNVIRLAVADGADLLITHHALLYHPVSRIDTQTARGAAIATALAHDLTIYTAHTNLDIAEGGVNDVLAELFGLRDVEVLDPMQHERFRKLVVFVPESHHEAVLDAVCSAGAGHIGNYSHCTFNAKGFGTFLPQEGSQPFLGEVGKLERADEIRLETIVPEDKVEAVVRAMLEAHPYEEVAYDLYPLELTGKPYGIGRIGNLPQSVPLEEFAGRVKQALNLPNIRFGGDPEHPVQRVAVLGGSGSKWAAKALAKGADVLVTADCDHHAVADAWQDGLAIVDATHASLERPVMYRLQQKLAEKFGSEVLFTVADVAEDPFHWR